MTSNFPSRVLVLATISLMVILQTVIFMMSNMKGQSSSDETASSTMNNRLDFNFPFLKDSVTIKYISTQIQVMFVLRDIPDKGTLPLAQAIADTYKDSAMCCFSSSKHSDGGNHSRVVDDWACQDQIQDRCKKHTQVIIVNGTDSTPTDLQTYFSLAHQYNYTTLVIEPNATSMHNQSRRVISESTHDIAKNDDTKTNVPGITYPFFYGWFLGFHISLDTQGVARRVFRECIQQPKFVEIFKKYALPGSPRNASGGLDFDHYFSLEGFITGTTLLHCTSFFSNYSERAGSKQYATSPAVRQGTGRAYNLTVIGFFITPRTFGARIRLDEDELLLWAKNDSVASELVKIDEASSADKVLHQEKDKLVLKSSRRANPEKLTFDLTRDNEVKCPKEWYPTKFSPTCGPGSRAHLTLGTGTGIEAVQTGFDLDAIIQKELEAVEKTEVILTLPLHSGTVRCYGEDNWAVYLDKPLQIGALFAAWY